MVAHRSSSLCFDPDLACVGGDVDASVQVIAVDRAPFEPVGQRRVKALTALNDYDLWRGSVEEGFFRACGRERKDRCIERLCSAHPGALAARRGIACEQH